ncbi:uncharacterized protein LOC122519116 [Polistes fuscatus]|uniref:uncharacterized protein LOC122519116 n=1 Tax=Polistes fuscatus TaxID=30207 RepID=UPI001CA8A108|nr:uncharacterized protein LOC122519116 [Polistes fuscatus]XP_043494306.1 uncharacterized protein LOC122519116 [Polistes fuscatus]
MTEKRLSLGINVSILLILTIFGILLSLPLKLLLNTNYDVQSHENQSENDTDTLSNENKNKEILELLIDYRKLKLCRRHGYKDRIRSIFYSDYDENCMYVQVITKQKEETNFDSFEQVNELVLKVDKKIEKEVKKEEEEKKKKKVKDNEEEESQESKEIVVAGHILVTMLLVSAIAALVEVLRIRFSTDKNKDSSSRGNVPSRKSSTVDLPIQRRFLPREPMKSQKSFELLGMHRSSLRLLGERPTPLIRRSSFPTQQANNKRSAPSATGTPNIRMSRRQSAESEEEIGVLITALHHRTRLIRRH